MALSRLFLAPDGLDFEVEVSRVPNKKIRNLMQLRLHRISKGQTQATTAMNRPLVDFRVAAKTETASLAGAIAKQVRNGYKVVVTAIGPMSVFRAVDAVAKARQFLNKEAMDIVFVPEFREIAVPVVPTREEEKVKEAVVKAVQIVVFPPSVATEFLQWVQSTTSPHHHEFLGRLSMESPALNCLDNVNEETKEGEVHMMNVLSSIGPSTGQTVKSGEIVKNASHDDNGGEETKGGEHDVCRVVNFDPMVDEFAGNVME